MPQIWWIYRLTDTAAPAPRLAELHEIRGACEATKRCVLQNNGGNISQDLLGGVEQRESAVFCRTNVVRDTMICIPQLKTQLKTIDRNGTPLIFFRILGTPP